MVLGGRGLAVTGFSAQATRHRGSRLQYLDRASTDHDAFLAPGLLIVSICLKFTLRREHVERGGKRRTFPCGIKRSGVTYAKYVIASSEEFTNICSLVH